MDNRKTILLIGNPIVELYDDNTGQLGGSFNVLRHLGQYHNVRFIVPESIKNYYYLIDSETIYDIENNSAYDVRYVPGQVQMPVRCISNNKTVYKKNGFYGTQVYSFADVSPLIGDLSEISGVYIEDHVYESHVRQDIAGLSYEILQQKVSPIRYLDCRMPAYSRPEFSSKLFAETYLKMNTSEMISYMDAGNRFDDLRQQVNLLYTLGEQGAYWIPKQSKDSHYFSPTSHQHVYAIGCGDSFMATFVANHVSNKSITECMIRAIIAGGIAVSQNKVVLVTPEEVQQYYIENM